MSSDNDKDREALLKTFKSNQEIVVNQIKTERDLSVSLIREISGNIIKLVETIETKQEKGFDRMEREINKIQPK